MGKLRGDQIDVGTGANQLVQLDGSGNLPTVDGSSITNVDAASLNGVVAGTGANQIVTRDVSGNLDADTLGGFSVGTGANNIVQLDGSANLPAVDGSAVTNVDAASLNGVTAGAGANQIVTRDGFGNLDADTLGGLSVGTGANNIVQLDGSSNLPAVNGSALTFVDAVSLGGYSVGTGPNNIVKLDGSSKLPAVDGSNLINLPSGGATVYSGRFNSSATVNYLPGGWSVSWNGASTGAYRITHNLGLTSTAYIMTANTYGNDTNHIVVILSITTNYFDLRTFNYDGTRVDQGCIFIMHVQ